MLEIEFSIETSAVELELASPESFPCLGKLEDEMSDTDFLTSLGISVVESQTQPTKPGKKPRAVWNIKGYVKAYEHLLYDYSSIKVKKWQGVLSCFEDPTQELAELIREHGAASFAEQQEGKLDRLEERADRLEERGKKHQAIAASARARVDAITQHIPFGQPILVGHHSERHARRDADRIYNGMRKSIDESNYAADLKGRAADARDRAEGDYTLEYLGNRVEECKTELRRIEVQIHGSANIADWKGHPVTAATGSYLNLALLEKQQEQEKLQYWEKLIEEQGGVQYSKANVKKGDWVCKGSLGWYRVYRANGKTVSLHYFKHDQSWTNACDYYDITDYCPKELAEQYMLSIGISLDEFSKMHTINGSLKPAKKLAQTPEIQPTEA